MKCILRNKVNFDVLEAFLSNLLKEDIKVLGILESESNQEVDYLQRLFWVTSKAVVEGIQLGSRYSEVVKVIGIR